MTDETALTIYDEYFGNPFDDAFDDNNRKEIVADIVEMLAAETLDDAVESVRYWGSPEQVRDDIAHMRAKYDDDGNVRTRATVDVPIEIAIVPECDGWSVTVPSLRGVVVRGDTFDEVLECAREAIRRHLDGMAS